MNQPVRVPLGSHVGEPKVSLLTDARWEAWVSNDPLAHPLFCGPIWARSAAEAFMPEVEILGVGWTHGGVVCTHDRSEQGVRFVGCDKVWAYPRSMLGQLTDDEMRALLLRCAQIGGGRYYVQVGLHTRTEHFRFLKVLDSLGWICVNQVPTGATVQLLMPKGPHRWFSGRRASFQRTIRGAEKKCKLMEVSFIRPRDTRALHQALSQVWQVELRSWKERNQEGPRVGAMRAFCEHAYRRAAARGELLLSFLAWRGEIIAYHAAWHRGRHGYGFQMSFDDRWRTCAPGAYLHWCVIQELHRCGVTAYDLGMQLPYKMAWANACKERYAVVAAPSALQAPRAR